MLLSGWGVVQVIADHIDSKTFEEDVKLIAVKVLLNFSVASETIEAETGEEDATISMSIFTSGGAHAILALVQQFSENAGLVLNAVECLNNICLERPGGGHAGCLHCGESASRGTSGHGGESSSCLRLR